jgi:myo-inositol 2-dehydrogenase / D-chiro-inositol 1-dehydrogenase
MGLRIGVIGVGVMGAAHCQTIARNVSGAELVAVSDVDSGRAARVADELGGARVHDDPHALVRDPDVDAVVIASSDETHLEFALACLSAEKNVLCEKPLAPTAAASLPVVEAEAALGRRLVQVAFMRRFDAGYLALKERLDAGSIGAPLLVHCAHRNRSVPPSFTTEMLFTSSVTHEVDITRWLLEREIVAATVFTPRSTRLARHGVRDPQIVMLESEHCVLVDVEVFVNAQYGYDIRCEVVGESGTLTLPPPVDVVVRHEGHDGRRINPDFRARFTPAYRDQFQTWADAVRSAGAPNGPSAWDGYAAAAVVDACVESLHSGRRAEVRLAARPELYARDERAVAAAG